MSAQHKEALAAGRNQARVVRRYLEALDVYRPRPGRRSTPETLQGRIAAIDAELGVAARAERASLVKERLHLAEELRSQKAAADLEELEPAFVGAVGPYSVRKGLTYAAWREVGVSHGVLTQAGLRKAGG